jgi:PHD/YefM family antitoxin component YafN of YafNO toxin-antitoxin module
MRERWMIHDRDGLPCYGYATEAEALAGAERINERATKKSGAPYTAVRWVMDAPDTTPPLALTSEEREAVSDAIDNFEWEAEQMEDSDRRARVERRAATLRALLARATTTGEGARGRE